jgi:hypothetical protein
MPITRQDVIDDIEAKITDKTILDKVDNIEDGANRVLIVDYIDQQTITKTVKVTLTPLQVQSLFTTRIKVIDCPTGYAILPIQMLCIANNPTTAYSPNGGGAVLRYDTLASNILSCNTTLGSVGIGEGYAISASSLTSSEFSRNGEDVYIKLASNDPIGGESGLVVYITYNLITL